MSCHTFWSGHNIPHIVMVFSMLSGHIFLLEYVLIPIKEIKKKKKIYPIYMNYVRFHPHPKLESVNLPPETGPILDWLVTL